jgi:1-acyl-sn-glycerol-3-phosphate acyltransferase
VHWGALVMEGRDIGTVVFPDTPYKFYLEASPETRAERRRRETPDADVDILESIAARDRKDSSRAVAPLRPAEDAEIIDTTSMSLEAVVRHVESSLAARDCPHASPRRPRSMTFCYRTHWSLLRFIFRHLLPVRVTGLENVPARGGAILAPNHASFLDPPLVGCLVPRPIFFIARSTLMKRAWMRRWLLSINALPLDREGISAGTMRRVMQLAREGELVLIFPEGTRQPEGRLGDAAGGVGLLVARCGVPVIPVRVRGTGHSLPRGRWFPRRRPMSVAFGPPLTFDPPPARPGASAHYRTIAREIMAAIGRIGPCADTMDRA